MIEEGAEAMEKGSGKLLWVLALGSKANLCYHIIDGAGEAEEGCEGVRQNEVSRGKALR